MRYYARVKGQPETLEVEVEPLDEGRVALTVHGQRRELDYRLVDSRYSLVLDGRSHTVAIEASGDAGRVSVSLRGEVTELEVLNERQNRLRGATAGFSAEGPQQVTAPMPGKVVRILVQKGEEVSEGQGLLVVEAMKMENELKSPKQGRVTELVAQEGSAVEKDALLAVIA